MMMKNASFGLLITVVLCLAFWSVLGGSVYELGRYHGADTTRSVDALAVKTSPELHVRNQTVIIGTSPDFRMYHLKLTYPGDAIAAEHASDVAKTRIREQQLVDMKAILATYRGAKFVAVEIVDSWKYKEPAAAPKVLFPSEEQVAILRR
jgi:hypothetical protein